MQHSIASSLDGNSLALNRLYVAIESGDQNAFLSALAAGGKHGFVHGSVASEIPVGFRLERSGQILKQTVAEVCFEFNQPEMLRAAANAIWPEHLGENALIPFDSMKTLCTRTVYGQQVSINLADHAASNRVSHSVEFIALALEHGQDCRQLDTLSEQNSEACALIAAARMRVAIDSNPESLVRPSPVRCRGRCI